MQQDKLIVCDVCDTLFGSNTTFDFLSFVAREGGGTTAMVFKFATSKISPLFFLLIVAGRLFGKDLARSFSLRCLKNMKRSDLTLKSEIFFQKYLALRINKNVKNLITGSDSKNVILVSSSIDVVVEVIAKHLGVKYYSSQLEIRDGYATGRLETDLTGKKHMVVKKLISAGNLPLELTVVTDNKSDWELMKMAQHRVAVVKSDAQKLFWKQLNPVFIEV